MTARKGSAEDRKGDACPGMGQVGDRVHRIESPEDARRVRDAAQAKQSDGGEPDQHHRPKDPADELGSFPLNQEQADQDGEADRNHDARELGGIEFEALNRAEHRDGGRDHAIAVEQCGSNKPDDEE